MHKKDWGTLIKFRAREIKTSKRRCFLQPISSSLVSSNIYNHIFITVILQMPFNFFHFHHPFTIQIFISISLFTLFFHYNHFIRSIRFSSFEYKKEFLSCAFCDLFSILEHSFSTHSKWYSTYIWLLSKNHQEIACVESSLKNFTEKTLDEKWKKYKALCWRVKNRSCIHPDQIS